MPLGGTRDNENGYDSSGGDVSCTSISRVGCKLDLLARDRCSSGTSVQPWLPLVGLGRGGFARPKPFSLTRFSEQEQVLWGQPTKKGPSELEDKLDRLLREISEMRRQIRRQQTDKGQQQPPLTQQLAILKGSWIYVVIPLLFHHILVQFQPIRVHLGAFWQACQDVGLYYVASQYPHSN